METISRPAALENHLGFWLRLVSNHVSHAFAQRLEALGVTVVEWVLLRELYDAEKAPSSLAERMGMTRGAITKLANRLARRGLIGRKADARDGRAQLLALTGQGRALVPRLAAQADRNDADFFGMLKPAGRAALEKLLQEIARRHGLQNPPIE
jgi:DNA-binding MarR family transcriptional regulator